MSAFSFLRFLTMLGLLLMPLAMSGQGHAVAAASHGGAETFQQEDCHSDSMPQQEERRQDGAAECMTACAALPAMESPTQEEAQAPRSSLYALPIAPIGGLAPEAETPPPRYA